MTNVKSNFKSMYEHENINCNLCDKPFEQTDAHLLDCVTIIANCPILANNCESEYEDIFEDSEKQQKIALIYKAVFETKTSIEEQSI